MKTDRNNHIMFAIHPANKAPHQATSSSNGVSSNGIVEATFSRFVTACELEDD